MNMYNRHNITKSFKLIFGVYCLLVLSACSSNDDSAEKTETVTEIPQFIQKLALNTAEGTLLAWITIDPDGTRTKLDIDLIAGTASKTITLSRLEYNVLIEFEFTDGIDTITLATAIKTIDLSSGDKTLSFADGEYTTAFDEDNDTFTNIVEITNNSDPLDPLDLPSISECILDESVIGGCNLG